MMDEYRKWEQAWRAKLAKAGVKNGVPVALDGSKGKLLAKRQAEQEEWNKRFGPSKHPIAALVEELDADITVAEIFKNPAAKGKRREFEDICRKLIDMRDNVASRRLETDSRLSRPIDDNEAKILAYLLNKHPKLVGQYEFETGTTLSRRTVSSLLERLRTDGITSRPNGTRKGEGLTPDGLELARKIAD